MRTVRLRSGMFLRADVTSPVEVLGSGWSVVGRAFLLTVAMEWPLLAWWSGYGLRRTGWFCLLLNGASWGFSMGLRELWAIPVPPLEVAIILVEGGLLVLYYRWPWQRALSISLGMNLVSWLLGTALLLAWLKLD